MCLITLRENAYGSAAVDSIFPLQWKMVSLHKDFFFKFVNEIVSMQFIKKAI